MRVQHKSPTIVKRRLNAESGASIVEMIIVLMIIAIVSTWAFLRIVDAQQAARLSASTQQLTAYLDKARLDSIRRHATNVDRMALVSINSATSYSVRLDADGNGELDTARVFTFPQGISFNVATYPTVVRFNWRGRLVDNAGAQTNTPAAISLQDTHGPGPSINLSAAGDTTTYSNVNITSVNLGNTNLASANIRPRTQMPSPSPNY